MKRIDDPRLVFYLQHQQLIDEWASVKKDIKTEAHSFNLGLGPDLEKRTSDLGSDVLVEVFDSSWSRVALYRDTWPVDGRHPIISICFEWRKSSCAFTDDPKAVGVSRALGVWTDSSHHQSPALRTATADLIRDLRSDAGFPRSSTVWPAYQDVPSPAEPRYWEDLQPYADMLVGQLVAAWGAFAESIDQATSEVAGAS